MGGPRERLEGMMLADADGLFLTQNISWIIRLYLNHTCPNISATWYLPAIIVPGVGWKFLSSSNPVLYGSNIIFWKNLANIVKKTNKVLII